MTIQEMNSRKREIGLSNEELSRRSGVPVSTVQKVLSGKTQAPRQQTVQALTRVLSQQPVYYETEPAVSAVCESVAVYAPGGPLEGPYTIDDYYALPDERRVELIDGVIYDMAAPSLLHQKILGELHLQFRACADAHGGQCDVYLSPCDVRLDMDNKTMLQPDLFVVCRDYDQRARAFDGAPDLVVEILSPSTRSKDMLLKLNKYFDAHVREYWIIDPQNKTVYTYLFTDRDFHPNTYPFDAAEIPIGISEGSCSIDFSKIYQRISAHL